MTKFIFNPFAVYTKAPLHLQFGLQMPSVISYEPFSTLRLADKCEDIVSASGATLGNYRASASKKYT